MDFYASVVNNGETEQNQITLFGMHPWTTLKRLLATPCSLTFKWKARYEVPDFYLKHVPMLKLSVNTASSYYKTSY
jgi:hypothetical protein